MGPFLAELLGETVLRRNGHGPSVLLVLRAARLRGGTLTLLECLSLVEMGELREDECHCRCLGSLLAEAACLRHRWQQRCRLCLTAALIVLLQANQCSRRAVGGPRAFA
jgi:hypothetical protein